MTPEQPRSHGDRPRLGRIMTGAALLGALSSMPLATAQSECISLEGSSSCRAFEIASISKNEGLITDYPFLSFVSDASSLDEELDKYVKTTYVQRQYQDRFGCDNVDLLDSADLYARFTTSTICNALVQKSIEDCGLSEEASLPLCADDCTNFAQSEAYIVADPELCSNPAANVQDSIVADFAGCTGPDSSLQPSCIRAINNEPLNCGYGGSIIGLCSYCSEGGINSTDSCCWNSDTENVCQGVDLPTVSPTVSLTPLPTETETDGPSSTNAVPAPAGGNDGLSGGAIAGIVVGCVVGVALLALAIFFLCIRRRRRNTGSQDGSIFNQPAPSRKGPQTAENVTPLNQPPQGYTVLPGGRIARMSALEGHSADSPSRHGGSRHTGSAGAPAISAGASRGASRKRDQSSSSDFAASIESDRRAGILRPPPTTIRRNGSLSSNSMLVGEDPNSPTSAGGMSSPPGVNSQQSEQLPFFKDYYSQDDIHPGDRVATLWAYQPRAVDEFTLERGDMLKVVGIWDDGWATGIMLDERADEWEARRQAQRDSGVSHASGRGREISPPVSGEIKAFPLVCVCLPEHWRKTIEGDGSTENGSSAHQG